MADQVVSCGVFAGGGQAPRASVNGLQFVECGVMAGGGLADAKVGASIGIDIIGVDSWSPADLSEDVDHNHSALVNIHANADTAEKDILYDAGDYSSGTLENAVAIGDGVQLDTNSPGTDFEDYNIAALQDPGQPEVWTKLDATAWSWGVTSGGEAWDGQGISLGLGNAQSHVRYDTAGVMAGGTIECDWYADNTYPSFNWGVSFLTTGSGTALRGHSVCISGSNANFRRIQSATAGYGVYTAGLGFTPSYDTLYKLKVMFDQAGGYVRCWFKFWLASGSEPASWTWCGQDSAYVNDGYVGYHVIGSAVATHARSDNYYVVPDPAQYYSSGSWESGLIDMTDVGVYSYATVDWDETAPQDTTAVVKARWRNEGTWLACTNGGEVPGITCGEQMSAGSSKDSLEFRIELGTTDTLATPLVENLHLYHEPIANAALEITVDGVSATEAAGTLDIWGKSQVSGGTPVIAWDDILLQTFCPWHFSGIGKSIELYLVYNGLTIDGIVWDMARDAWAESDPFAGWQFSMNPIKTASAPVEGRYNVHDRWSPMGHNYEWVLIDKGIAIHADGWYIVGHYQLDSHPGSFLLGKAELQPHPGSFLLRGDKLDPHPGSFLVQGHRLDSHPGFFLIGEMNTWSHPGSFIIGVEHMNAHPGSYLVYGVNRDGAIFVNVVDDATYAKLVAEGIIFS